MDRWASQGIEKVKKNVVEEWGKYSMCALHVDQKRIFLVWQDCEKTNVGTACIQFRNKVVSVDIVQ